MQFSVPNWREDTSFVSAGKNTIARLLRLAKRRLPVEFSFIIVQPFISMAKVGDEVLKLLDVTQNFVHDLAGVALGVIASA